jgi:hypothetical protein
MNGSNGLREVIEMEYNSEESPSTAPLMVEWTAG